MEIALKKLLEGALVVPYSDEEIERLEKVCSAVLEGNEFSDDTVADLAIMVLTHIPNTVLKDEFETEYEAQNETKITLPRSVCETLAAYTVYKAIEKDDVAYQLALLNTMVIMDEKWEHVPYPELFAYCIEKSIATVDGKANMGDVADESLFTQIFDGQKLKGQSVDDTMLAAMKSIARDAWYHRTQAFLDGEELKEHSTYIKVFVGLSHIVDSMPWDFLNQRVLEQIRTIVPRGNAKELTIAEIIEQVKPYYDTERDLNSHSSILLHMMADDDYEGHDWVLVNSKLSVRKFAIYLYYELMLEKYLN